MTFRRFAIFALVIGALCLIAHQHCHAEQPTIVSDDFGISIAFTYPFQRIVSLTPSITEGVFALDAGEQLVGITTYCDYPAETRQKTKVGDIVHPNVERILQLKPDLILGAGNARSVMKKLSEMGVPCLVFRSESLADIRNDLSRLGALLGKEEQAAILLQDMDDRIQSARLNAAQRAPSTALLAFDLRPIIVAGENTLGDELLELIGCVNIARSAQGRYPKVSMEFVVQQGPDFFFYAGEGTEKENEALRAEWAAWSSVPAVAAGRVYSVSADLISRPSLRLLDGLRSLECLLEGVPNPELVRPEE